jgi:hypothetical protein
MEPIIKLELKPEQQARYELVRAKRIAKEMLGTPHNGPSVLDGKPVDTKWMREQGIYTGDTDGIS